MKEANAKKIASLEEQMRKLMDEMKQQAEAELQKVVEEKEMTVTRLEIMAEVLLLPLPL